MNGIVFGEKFGMFRKVTVKKSVVVYIIAVFKQIDAVLSEVSVNLAFREHLKVINLFGFVEVKRTQVVVRSAYGLAGICL